MTNQHYLRQSAILSVIALILLLVVALVSNLGQHLAGQELFETITDPAAYAKSMIDATPALRIVLALDAVFALCYTAAICFAALGFRQNNPPLAWFAALGIICVMALDFWENMVMGHSIDIAALTNQVSLERITLQAGVSAAKWHLSAAVLFALSFLLPGDNFTEKLLIWGTRTGLAIGVPLFVVSPLELREIGVLIIAISMIGGFVLLAIVAWRRSKAV